MLRSRRFALIAAATLLGLSACGDSDPRTTPASTLAVIHLGAAGAGGTAPAEASTADRMMMAMDVTYVIDGEIADPGATGLAWTLPGDAVPDLARVAEIARLLGVEGDVRELPADQGGGWMVGAEDYSTATLSVSADGMLSWWYNPAPQPVANTAVAECVYYPVDDVQPAVAETSPDTSVATGAADPSVPLPECPEVQPPANVPDEAAARTLADQLFAQMGYATGDLEYEVYADEWGASVTAFVVLDGHRSPITLSAGFGADGAVTWASGSLATPVRAGEYPLVGIDAGLVRLNDQTGRWSGYWGSPSLMARAETTDVAIEPAVAAAPTDTAGAVPGQIGDTVPIDSPVCDPAADCVPETYPAPEPITVHLTGATLGLSMVWAQDGTIWLLPAYTFTDADGGQYTVVAVDDAFIDLPEPFPTDTMPIDTVPIDTVPIDTVPTDTVPTDSVPSEPVPTDSAVVTVSS